MTKGRRKVGGNQVLEFAFPDGAVTCYITLLLSLDRARNHLPETFPLKRMSPALAARQKTGRQDPQPPAHLLGFLLVYKVCMNCKCLLSHGSCRHIISEQYLDSSLLPLERYEDADSQVCREVGLRDLEDDHTIDGAILVGALHANLLL